MKKTKVNMNRFKRSGNSQLLQQTLNEKTEKIDKISKTKPKTTISACNKDIGIFKNIFVENSIVGSIKDAVHIPSIHTDEISNPNYMPLRVLNGIIIENNNQISESSLLTKQQIEELIDQRIEMIMGKNKNKLEVEVNEIEEKLEAINVEKVVEKVLEEHLIETVEDKVEDKNLEDRLDEITLDEKSIKSTEVKRGRRNYKKNEEKLLE